MTWKAMVQARSMATQKIGYRSCLIQTILLQHYPRKSPLISQRRCFLKWKKINVYKPFFRFPEAVDQAAGEPTLPIVEVAGHQEVEKPKLALTTEQKIHSPEKTFQQQVPSKQYSRNREQSPRHQSRNQPAESPDRSTGQFYPQHPKIIYQQSSGSSCLLYTSPSPRDRG